MSAEDQAHQLLYASVMHIAPQWLGVPVRKSPLDLWALQALIYRVRPQLIIETGTAYGGSAYFYASLFDLLHHGQVLTIDIDTSYQHPPHPRIRYVTGSSTDSAVVAAVRARCDELSAAPVMVILDSDHHQNHVWTELELYAPFVTPDSYLIVEDTNLNGGPVLPDFGPGPREATAKFLASPAGAGFSIDRTVEPLLTFNPCGFLRRR